MNRIAVIQARMTSTRLPGKVLMDLCGRPMLSRQLSRIRQATRLDGTVIATTVNATDDPVVDLAEREEVAWFRGSEEDVLSRFVGAARQEGAELIVRLTADCPLIDAELIDRVVAAVEDAAGRVDYCSNVLERSYPRGLDVEAFTMAALDKCDRLGVTAAAREHVTIVIRQLFPDQFTTMSVTDAADNSDLRWTVDTPADLELVRRIFSDLKLAETYRGYRDIVAYVRTHPELMTANSGIETWDPLRHHPDDTKRR